MSDLLAGLPYWFLLTLLTILGAIWGSFAAALCSRWPKGEGVVVGRSRCEQCGKGIASYDLVPVISYMLLRGKCRFCGQKIGARPIVIELAAALIGAVSLLLLPPDQAVAAAIFGWLLLPLVILDFDHLWLPDRLVLVLAAAGLAVGSHLTPDLAMFHRVIGAVAGFASLELIRRSYKLYRKQDGMGAGDPKLFGALGIWLGWQALPLLLLAASVIGIAFAAWHAVRGHEQKAFPFGSYLGVAAWLIALVG
jgi:leader peptidase (prepilin peptidase)/N-methyltransferase